MGHRLSALTERIILGWAQTTIRVGADHIMIIRVADYQARGIILRHSVPVHANDKEQICYDLHVGESIKRPGDDTRRRTPKKIRLKPNDCIRIETREEFSVPNDVFGTVCSRASLTAEGLVAANLKIDPKFHGKLFVTIYNTSRNINTIDTDLPFCSIFFQPLETPVPDTAPIRRPPEPKIITGPRIQEAFLRALPFILTFVASVAASLIASYIFGWFNPAPAAPSAALQQAVQQFTMSVR